VSVTTVSLAIHLSARGSDCLLILLTVIVVIVVVVVVVVVVTLQASSGRAASRSLAVANVGCGASAVTTVLLVPTRAVLVSLPSSTTRLLTVAATARVVV
jgi:preprotein translocase subunit SecG